MVATRSPEGLRNAEEAGVSMTGMTSPVRHSQLTTPVRSLALGGPVGTSVVMPASKTRALPSQLAVAIDSPSGLHAMSSMGWR